MFCADAGRNVLLQALKGSVNGSSSDSESHIRDGFGILKA